MSNAFSRRRFGKFTASGLIASLMQPHRVFADETAVPDRHRSDRGRALLLGSLLGDALGGPMEFSSTHPEELCNARAWPKDRLIDEQRLNELADTLPLIGYETIRPSTAPYGPWKEKAPAGTLTDDSRHKVVLMMAIDRALADGTSLQAEHVAHAFLSFSPHGSHASEALRALQDEGLREYRYAARWLLGERDRKQALPVERLWAGIDNCSGQMLLPPLAIAFAGRPEAAYEQAYDVDFIDSPGARDIAAAIVAGLAAVLSEDMNQASVEERWQCLFDSMSRTDPLRLGKVPFAGRPLDKWLKLSDDISKKAEGSPARLYELLETDGKPVYWWDAHFTLLVPVTVLKFCDYNPLAAMHLTLDFGHDTDSYAQILGCMIGAVHGPDIFPQDMVRIVEASLEKDYRHNIADWLQSLHTLGSPEEDSR